MKNLDNFLIFKKFGLFSIIVLIFGLVDVANAEQVPDWVKKVSLWFGQDIISENEFLNAIEFLIEKGIILIDSSDAEQDDIIISPSDDAEDLWRKGIHQLRVEDPEDALVYFDEALKKSPNDARILIDKGVAKAQSGDLDGAKEIFDTAILLSENKKKTDYRAVFNAGLATSIYGDQKEALQYFDKIIANKKLVSSDLLYATLINTGAIFYELEKYEESLPFFDEARQIFPNKTGWMINKANSLQEMGRYDEALELFEKAYSISRDISFKPTFIVLFD